MTTRMARLDDLVIALLHFVRKSHETFPADREFLHRTFFRLKEAFPRLLGTMEFRSKGMFPESLVLDQALSNLEAARALHRKNAEPSYYQIEDSIDRSYNRFVDPRLKAAGLQERELKRLANAFAKTADSVPA